MAYKSSFNVFFLIKMLVIFLLFHCYYVFCFFFCLMPPCCLLPHYILSLSLHFSIAFKICPSVPDVASEVDHARKIELIRYLMSGYVHGQVLDTLSEHANALASTAVASLENGADQLSHFPFLPVPNDPVLTVPKHHGWYIGSVVYSSMALCCA